VNQMFAPLRHRAFRYVVLGRTVTMLGNGMAPIALAFAVLDLTGSAADLGLVVGARSLTNVLFLLFGGVVADRLPRQFVVVVASGLSFLTQGAVAALVLTDHATVPVLMALGAVNGLTAAFAFPATSALLPQTVPPAIRKQANAINRLGINFAMIVGASLGGFLVATFEPGWALAVDAATFALAGLFFALVRVPSQRAADAARTSTWTDLRAGWSEFTSHTWVWVVVLGFCFFNMAEVAGLSVLGPTVADSSFGRQTWGFLIAVETVGAVLGAFLAMRLRARRLLLIGTISCTLPAAFLIVLGAGLPVAVLFVLAFATGVGLEQFGIAWETSLQEHIPEDKLARVYSYDALGSFIAIPVGQVAAGPLAERVGTEAALIIAGGVAMLATLGMLASRSVRTLTHDSAAHATPAASVAAQPDASEPEVAGASPGR